MDLARGSIWAFFYRGVGAFLWLLIGVITARALTVSDRGSYSSAVAFIASAAGVSASFAASSGYFVSNQRRPAGEVASNTILLSGVVSLALLAVAGVVALASEGEFRTLALFVGLGIVPDVARNGIAGVFLGIGRIGRWAMSAYVPPAAGIVTVTLWVVVLDHHDATNALGAWVAGQYLSLVLAAALGWRWWGWFGSHRPDLQLMRRVVTFGTMTGLVAFMGILNARAGQLLVIWLDSRTAAGLYASAAALSEGALFFATAVSTASFARIGSLERQEAATLTARTVRHALVLSLPAAAMLFVLAPWVITVLFGTRYEDAGLSLRILTVGAAVAAPRVLLGNYFIVQLGRPHLIFGVSLAASVLNIVLGLILIPQAGYAGAAVAASVSYCLATIVTVALFLATSEVPANELWRVTTADIALYVRLARQFLHGQFSEPAPAESAP